MILVDEIDVNKMSDSYFNFPQLPGLEPYYRHKYIQLKALEPDALIPDLQKVVIDYAVEIKDYTILKEAFIMDLNYRVNETFGRVWRYVSNMDEGEIKVNEIEQIDRWRSNTLYQNTAVDVKTVKCDDCHLEFRGNEGGCGTLWGPYSYWCGDFDDYGCQNHYCLCFKCHYRVNPERVQDKFERHCQFH